MDFISLSFLFINIRINVLKFFSCLSRTVKSNVFLVRVINTDMSHKNNGSMMFDIKFFYDAKRLIQHFFHQIPVEVHLQKYQKVFLKLI